MRKKIKLGFIILILLATVLVFTDQRNNDNYNNSVTIGVILPLSGQYGFFGESAKNALVMSLEDLGDDRVSLIFEDDGFDSKKGLSAYKKLISIDDADCSIQPPTTHIVTCNTKQQTTNISTYNNSTEIIEDRGWQTRKHRCYPAVVKRGRMVLLDGALYLVPLTDSAVSANYLIISDVF